MSYKRAYRNKGLSARSRLLMELDDERSLEEDIKGNVLSDTTNHAFIEMPHYVTQVSANANANPSPGSNSTIKRARPHPSSPLANFLPDEMELNSQDAPESQLVRRDLDGYYNCGIDTAEVSPSQPGATLHMKCFGNDPAYNGSKQNLRFLAEGDSDAIQQQTIMGTMAAIGSGFMGGLRSMFGSAKQLPQPARPAPEVIEAKAKLRHDRK